MSLRNEPKEAMCFRFRWFDTLDCLPEAELRQMLKAIRATETALLHEGETEISARGMACRKGLKLRKLQTKLSIRTGGVQ